MNNKKKKFPAVLFAAASLMALAVLIIIYLLIKADFEYKSFNDKNLEDSSDRFYLNENYNPGDPFITKRPQLEDMLTGPIITKLDPSMGDKYAPVIIVEYADFECDFCQKQEQIFKKIMPEYKYRVRLVWKDYPENNSEAASFRAAVAGRCAQEQGKFWEYHDFLFGFNKELNRKKFIEIAEIINLDTEKFKECLNSERPKKLIYENIDEANALRINGIPFVYVNDQEIMGQINYEDLEKIIKIELGKGKK